MRKKILLAAMVGVTCAFATSAHAVTVTFDATNTSNIPGLTGFMTLGDMMDGLEVTVTFASGGSETRSWADTGFQSGGVAGVRRDARGQLKSAKLAVPAPRKLDDVLSEIRTLVSSSQ